MEADFVVNRDTSEVRQCNFFVCVTYKLNV